MGGLKPLFSGSYQFLAINVFATLPVFVPTCENAVSCPVVVFTIKIAFVGALIVFATFSMPLSMNTLMVLTEARVSAVQLTLPRVASPHLYVQTGVGAVVKSVVAVATVASNFS